jgi:membrane-associated phospholipid phosphatase
LGRALDGQEFGRPGTLFDHLGEPHYGLGIAALFYGGGALADSDQARRTGVTVTESLLVSMPVSLLLKVAFGRERPYSAGTDADAFRFFGGRTKNSVSFPSGHATIAFTVASAVAENYESHWVDAAAYGLAAGVGFSRVYQDRHWTSDITAGAILGIVIGKGVTRWERRRGAFKNLYTDGRNLALVWHF